MANVQADSAVRQVHGPHFALPPSKATQAPDLRSLQLRLEQIVHSCVDKPDAVNAYLNLAKSLTNAIDVAYAYRTGKVLNSVLAIGDSDIFKAKERKELLLHWSSEACTSGAVQLNRLSQGVETIATLPVYADGKAVDAINAALLVPRGEIEPFVVSLQLVATSMGVWHQKHAGATNAFEARTSAAIIELLSKCHDATNLDESTFVLATEMQKLVDCEIVVIALRKKNSRRIKVAAISGSGAVDQNSEVLRQITETAEESLDRRDLTIWPPLSMKDRHATKVHQQLVENSRYQAVASCPLETVDDLLGAWLFLGKQETIHSQDLMNIVQAATPHVATSLSLRIQADAGPFTRLRRITRGTPEKRRTRRSIFIACMLTGLLLMIPIPHKISCNCTVEPYVRRFASVPFNGVLRDSLVEPGDFVSANQVLARMDDRDLRLEKSESMAARTKALKKYDKQRADEQIAEALIAKYEAEEMDAKLNLLQHREENLEIKSPIDGVILDGDLEDVEGATVQRGQMLFEIAPLDSLKLKLAIPEEDISFTVEEMAVTAKLDGVPGKKLNATLQRITPRAKADTGQNHFVADASLAEIDKMLRPGMSGTAKLIGLKRPIGWILFHKAYHKLSDMIEW